MPPDGAKSNRKLIVLIMAHPPTIAADVPALHAALAHCRKRGETVALVPTMGALHAGHLALVRAARERADRVVVSIFVNPEQFAPNEDFASYPRSLDTDVAALSPEGVDLVWAPTANAMYPAGFSTRIVPAGPAVAGLEDTFRPHFFAGVATVVAKLFAQCRPDFALFGEKDYQQLMVVTQMARDLDLGVTVVGVPTVREPDGLALSSRNAYLSDRERAAAPLLRRALAAAADLVRAGEPLAATLDAQRDAVTSAGFALDYLEARNAQTLALPSLPDGPLRLLIAARIGKTRLIDNVAV